MKLLLALLLLTQVCFAQTMSMTQSNGCAYLSVTNGPPIMMFEWNNAASTNGWSPYVLMGNVMITNPFPYGCLAIPIQTDRTFWRVREWYVVSNGTDTITLAAR